MASKTTRRVFVGAVGALTATRSKAADREKVTGIGGLFFRAKDPKALAKWYSDYLGINLVPSNYNDSPWRQEAGPTAFQPFPDKTTYFGNDTKQWMVNFRVRDMDKMAAQLRTAGITVNLDPKVYPNGRFAHLQDPEGNPIELWEPQGRGAQ
ncbi:MAG: VOC family protein [Acidobacteriia bacterium]|nr:VOC family protein [Terriglobia bacterium]